MLDEWEFYDLAKDPEELRSIYGDPVYARVRARLETEIETELERLRKQ